MFGFKLTFTVTFFLVPQILSLELKNRMMNAIKTDIKYFPYVVALYAQSDTIGTGTILSSKYVLTAAHIWDEEDYPYATFTKDNTAIWYATSVVDKKHGESATIAEIHVHPLYEDTQDGLANDVSILEVKGELKLKKGLAEPKALVAAGTKYKPGYVCVGVGFGDTKDPVVDKQPHLLRFLPLPILRPKVCYKYLPDIPQTLICAGLLTVDAGACMGDSGGPLTCGGRLYAVLSYGTTCEQGGDNVNSFVPINLVRDFIKDITGIS